MASRVHKKGEMQMLLVKCKCGCFFTVKDDTSPAPQQPYLYCQNCGAKVLYSQNKYTLSDLKSDFSDAGMTVQKIPDDADITITFKA
jgi:hypothetical protein